MRVSVKTQIVSKFCGSDKIVKNGGVNGKQLYRCKDCTHQFLDNSAFLGMRTKVEVIASALNLYCCLSMWKIQRQIAKIFKVDVSPTAIWKWIMKYSKLLGGYIETLNPQLSGKYHHDETEVKVGGQVRLFWETIDEKTRYLVANLLTESRTSEDTKNIFTQALEKQRQIALFTDGSFTYDDAFNKVFYTRYKDNQVEWVRKVRPMAGETNQIIERKHGTLKDRLGQARGLKNDDTAKRWLKGYVINYNRVKPHIALKGKTPAQASGLGIKAGWGELIQQAILSTTKTHIGKAIEVVAK